MDTENREKDSRGHAASLFVVQRGERWKKQLQAQRSIPPVHPLLRTAAQRAPAITANAEPAAAVIPVPVLDSWSWTPACRGIGRACRTQKGSRSGRFTVLVDFPFWCSFRSVHGCFFLSNIPSCPRLDLSLVCDNSLPSPVFPTNCDPSTLRPNLPWPSREELPDVHLRPFDSPSATLARGLPDAPLRWAFFPRANAPRRRLLLRVIAARQTLCRRLVVASSLLSPSTRASRRRTADGLRGLSRCRQTDRDARVLIHLTVHGLAVTGSLSPGPIASGPSSSRCPPISIRLCRLARLQPAARPRTYPPWQPQPWTPPALTPITTMALTTSRMRRYPPHRPSRIPT